MKKSLSVFILITVLSFSILADDGQIPIGGIYCPPNETCPAVDPPGTPPGFVANIPDPDNTGIAGDEENSSNKQDIYERILNYLKSIL